MKPTIKKINGEWICSELPEYSQYLLDCQGRGDSPVNAYLMAKENGRFAEQIERNYNKVIDTDNREKIIEFTIPPLKSLAYLCAFVAILLLVGI